MTNAVARKALQQAIDLYHDGKVDEAIKGLKKAIGGFGPKVIASGFGYLGFLYMEKGDDAKATKAFKQCVKWSPKSEQASLGLFHSLWGNHKLTEALKEMKRFLNEVGAKGYAQFFYEYQIPAIIALEKAKQNAKKKAKNGKR